jgi:hypothetical protein
MPPDSAETRYADGAKDATYGRLPEYADDAYLAGYVAKLKQLPTQESGRIRHYSPCQHFAFGFMDGIGDGIDGESIREYF